MTNEPIMNLEVTAQELASLILAMYHEIIERCLWALEEGHWLRSRDIEDVQSVVNPMVTGYLKAVNLIRTIEDQVDPSFFEVHQISAEQWALLDAITMADSWEDIPLG